MENDKEKPVQYAPVKRNGCLFGSIVLIIIALIAISAAYLAKDAISSYVSKFKSVEEPVNNTDTVYKTLTIEDVLIARETVRESNRVDNVFMNIADPILVAILSRIGTDATIAEIVCEYENNNEYYSSVNFGADIQKQLTQQDEERQKNPEDSIEKPKL